MGVDIRRASDGSPSYLLVDDSHNLQTSGGGGSSGKLSDVILTDDSGTQFIARDSGTALTYIKLDGTTYTPSTNVRAVNVQAGTTASGSLTALNATVSLATQGTSTVFLEVAGNGTGFALTPQISQDGGATWINVSVEADGAGTSSTPVSSITATGNWSTSVASADHFRLLTATAITGGSTLTGTLTTTPAHKYIRSSAIGAQADTNTAWYTTAGSLLSRLALLIAAQVGAGSHVYGYTGTNLTTDAWTLFGTTRTKTYTYTSGLLTAESDWV